MIIVDCEMSGVDPVKHGIVSIGAVDLENPKRQFYIECHIDKDHEVMKNPPKDPTSTTISVEEFIGMSEKQMRDKKKPSIKEALTKFFKWVEESKSKTLVAQNYMDLMFLEIAARTHNLKYPIGHRFVDLHSVGYVRLIELKQPLPMKDGHSAIGARFLAKFTGIPEEPHPHNALTGAKYEAETFSRLVYGKNLLPEFKKFSIPEILKK